MLSIGEEKAVSSSNWTTASVRQWDATVVSGRNQLPSWRYGRDGIATDEGVPSLAGTVLSHTSPYVSTAAAPTQSIKSGHANPPPTTVERLMKEARLTTAPLVQHAADGRKIASTSAAAVTPLRSSSAGRTVTFGEGTLRQPFSKDEHHSRLSRYETILLEQQVEATANHSKFEERRFNTPSSEFHAATSAPSPVPRDDVGALSYSSHAESLTQRTDSIDAAARFYSIASEAVTGVRPRVDAAAKGLQRRYGGGPNAREKALEWVRLASQHEVECYSAHKAKSVYERHSIVGLGHAEMNMSGASFNAALQRKKSLKEATRHVDVAGDQTERSRARALSVSTANSKRGVEEYKWARGKAFTMQPLRPLLDSRFETPGPGSYSIPSEFQGPIRPTV